MVESYAPSGWKDLGSSKDDLWRQFVPDTGATFDRDDWQRRKRQEKPVAVPQTMSLDERDRFYRDWLAKNSLNERDRADLERRGVTDLSIALSCEFGYAVPFKGLEGQYLGAQWRYADPGDGARYRWHNLPGGKYYPGTNELPIAVYRPTVEPNGIALVEGTGIKPMLTAERLGMVAIGAAGGLHTASPIQMKAIIEAFPGLPIVVIPDAGDVINPHVMARHKRTAHQFPEAKFLWYEQVTKQENDVDEASAAEIASARSLTWAEFEAIAPSGKGFGKKETEQRDPNWGEPDRELYEAHQARTEEEWQNLRIEARNEKLKGFPLLKWNPDSLNHIRRIQSEKPDFDQEEQKRRNEKTWQKIARISGEWKTYQRDFKLSVEESDRYNIHRFDGYAPIFLPWQDTIYIRGGFGSGKTEAYLLSLLEAQWSDRCVVIVTPTNLLGENLIARARAKGIEAMAYQSDVPSARFRLHNNAPGLIVMCPDSFKEYSTGETSWKEKALFIDEFSTVRSHILDKPASLPHLGKGIGEAAFLMVADANLGDADVSAIENTFGRNQGTSRFYIQNATKDLTPVKVVQTLNKAGQISGTHDGVWFSLLESAIEKRSEAIDRGEKPEPIYLCSDNLTVLLVLQIWLERTHADLKVKRVSSLDVETNYGFMSVPDVAMAAEAIDILLGSPSMQSGCDIQTQFGTTIGIFTGVCTPTESMQHIKRVRKTREILLSIPTFNYRDEEAANLDRRNRKRLTKQAKNIFQSEGIESAGDLQAFGVWQEQISKLNAQFNHELTCAIASETFENIEYVYFEGGQSALYQEIRDEVKTDEALKTLTANHSKGQELIDAKKAPSRKQHVWDIKKAQLRKQFPDLVDALAEDLKTAIAALHTCSGSALYRDVLRQGKILLSSKLEKLKNHAIANSAHVEEHLANMTEALFHSHPTLNSKRFKRLRAVKLYHELNLVDLAKLGELDVELHQNVYSAKSPIVAELYTKFLVSESLKLYPEVTTIEQFWKMANAAIRACGHEQAAHEVRVESDQARPNGTFRGIPRETYSTKQYFVGFYLIEQSGNKVFRKHFTKFMDAVETLIDRELESQRTWKEKRKRTEESQPDWGDVAA